MNSRETKLLYMSEWQKNNRDRISKRHKEYTARKKAIVFEAYGTKCNCCGEDNPAFLSIDHVNNDGVMDRGKKRYIIYNKIIREGFPPSYQILCMNCNWGRRFTGVCPHKELQNAQSI